MKLLRICLFLLGAFCACQAQTLTDCSELPLGATGPPFTRTGGLCGDNGNQCCSPANLISLETRAEARLKEALADALDDSEEEYGLFTGNLTTYLTVQFINDLARNFPFTTQLDDDSITLFEGEISEMLEPNLIIADIADSSFNSEAFVTTLVDNVAGIASLHFVPQDMVSDEALVKRQCITREIGNSVNGIAVREIGGQIQTIRRSLTALVRISGFLRDYRQTLVTGFTPIRGCVERLVQWNYCSRCDLNTQRLCRGSCNSLVKGCLSPVYTAFQRDFRQLRTVSNDTIRILNSAIQRLYTSQRNLVTSFPDLISALILTCGLDSSMFQQSPTGGFTPPPGFTPPTTPPATTTDDDDNDDDTDVFDQLEDLLEEMDGIFDYDDDGPDVCEPDSDEENFCEDQLNEVRDVDSCRLDRACTSECSCFDGSQMRDTDTPTFRGNRVEDQRANLAMEGLTDDLEQQATMLGTDTPANAFLQSDTFREVVPEGVSIPEADPYTGGAVRVVVPVIVMAMAAMISLLL